MIKRLLRHLLGYTPSYDTLPPERLRAAVSIPFVRHALIQFSKDEFDRNPYYQSVINKLASHTIGPYPSIIGLSQFTDWNDNVEDAHYDWLRDNEIAWTYRQLRKDAALTGIGIAVPYVNKQTQNLVNLSYKCYGADCLATPNDASPTDRIYNGIEYDSNWEPVKFHIKDLDYKLTYVKSTEKATKEYRVEDVLYWSRGYENGMLLALPECYAAFTFYPFIRRFLQASIEGEEFRASFPMAIELDPAVYSPKAPWGRDNPPQGEFEYEPRSIKTLPPGASLKGLPQGSSSSDKDRLIKTFAAICALTVEMPANLAISDSSNSNMASAQVDIQPWANKIEIDRFDMEPVFRGSFNRWWNTAIRTEGVFTQRAMIQRKFPSSFPHSNIFKDIHCHPDPAKRANARAIDLASGATTLNEIYSKDGKNARRELERDTKLLGIPLEELMQAYLVTRGSQVINIIQEPDSVAQN